MSGLCWIILYFLETEWLKVFEVYTTILTKCSEMFKHAQRSQNNKSAIPFLGMTGWIVMIYDLVKLGLNLDFVVRLA